MPTFAAQPRYFASAIALVGAACLHTRVLAQIPEPDGTAATQTLDDQSIAELRAERDQLLARLTETLRQQFQAVETPADRSRFLAGLIGDPMPTIRILGFTLALQELANARQLGPEPGLAAMKALSCPIADERRLAGELLIALAPDGAAEALIDALAKERDPQVARVLLRTASRWPTTRALDALEQWATQPGPARGPALAALAESAKRGIVVAPSARTHVLAHLSENPSDEPSALTLQWLWGDELTRASVSSALADPSRTAAAAAALSCNADGARLLLAAAQNNASLFQIATTAAATHIPTASNYGIVSTLPAPDEDTRKLALQNIGAKLPMADLLTVARETSDRALRESLLARLETVPVRTAIVPRRGITYLGHDPLTIAGLVQLAQTRLELNQPGAALQALDAVGPNIPKELNAQAGTLRVLCLVAVDRIDEAVTLDASPAAWVQALELVGKQPQAQRVLAVIDARYASELPDDLAQRVQAIRRALGLFVGPTRDR